MAEEFPRGQLSTIILMCLTETDKYGYEIIDEVLKKTDGKLSIKQPSLYSSLKRMEEQSLISSYWRDSEIGGRRHYYHLTDLGKKHLEKWQTNIILPQSDKKLETDDTKTKVLQQESLFSISNTGKNELTQQQPVETKPETFFVQYDLFSNSQVITPPDTFPTKLDSEEIITNHSLTNIEKQQGQTCYNDQNNYTPIKTFEFVKKTNKSFADQIKNINSIQNKKYIAKAIEDVTISPPLNIKEIETNTSYIKQNEVQSNIVQQNIPNNDILENSPIYQPISKEQITLNKNLDINLYESKDITEITPLVDMPKISISSLDGYISNSHKNNSSEEINYNFSGTIENNHITIDENLTQTSLQQQTNAPSPKDDAVYITERLDIKDIPKQPKFEARKFEVYISDNSLSPKFNANTVEKYEDRIKELYEKSKTNAENQELELIDSKIKFTSYDDLTKFYNEQNIKFKPYQKTLYKSEKNFDMIKVNKLNMLTYLLMFCSIAIISLVFALPYSFKQNVKLNLPLTYIIVPLVSLIVFVLYFIIYQKSPQKRIAYDTNKFKLNISALFMSLFIIPIILAINLIFGFNFINFEEYSLTILYPLSFVLFYPIFYLIQKILSKSKLVY